MRLLLEIYSWILQSNIFTTSLWETSEISCYLALFSTTLMCNYEYLVTPPHTRISLAFHLAICRVQTFTFFVSSFATTTTRITIGAATLNNFRWGRRVKALLLKLKETLVATCTQTRRSDIDTPISSNENCKESHKKDNHGFHTKRCDCIIHDLSSETTYHLRSQNLIFRIDVHTEFFFKAKFLERWSHIRLMAIVESVSFLTGLLFGKFSRNLYSNFLVYIHVHYIKPDQYRSLE